MLEKGMQKTWEVLQNGARMGAKIEKQSIKNPIGKSMQKRAWPEGGGGRVGG